MKIDIEINVDDFIREGECYSPEEFMMGHSLQINSIARDVLCARIAGDPACIATNEGVEAVIDRAYHVAIRLAVKNFTGDKR